MQRTAIGLFLSIALVFAALPGVVALSFAGGNGDDGALTRVVEPQPRQDTSAESVPVARGMDTGTASGCPFGDSDSSSHF